MDYPLVAPSADIQYLLADFHIAYRDQTQTIQHPLRIKWLYGIGCDITSAPSWAPEPTHEADILVVDANDVTVFDSTITPVFNTWCWGRKKTDSCDSTHAYQVYEWADDSTTCQLIAHKTWPLQSDANDADLPRHYHTHLTPQNAVLDERAVYKKPKQVTSFILADKTGAQIAQFTQPTIEFAAGYNMLLTPTDNFSRGLRRTNSIEFTPTPGAGLGKYVDCEDTPIVITSLNGLPGPNVILDAHDCLWTRPPLAYVPAGESAQTPKEPNSQFGVLRTTTVDGHTTQQIGSDCKTPCCTCDDYVDIAKYMNNTRDRYKTIGMTAYDVLNAHKDNIDRWTSQRSCRQSRPLKGCMTAQRCPFLDVVVQYCNMCEKCAQNAILNLEFEAANSAKIVCGYTAISNSKEGSGAYRLNGEWPSFTAPLGVVDAGNSVSVTFRLEFAEAKPTNVRLALTGSTENGPIAAGCEDGSPPYTAVINKALRCDGSGNTIQQCE